MKNSRFIKLFSGFVICIFVVFIIFYNFSSRWAREKYLDMTVENLTDLSLVLQSTVQPLLEQENRNDLQALIQTFDQQTGTRVSIILPDGEVFAESSTDFKEMESHLNRPEVKSALQGEQNSIVRYSTTAKEELLYVATPLMMDGKITGILRLSVFLEPLNSLLTQLRSFFFLAVMIMLFISLGISYWISLKLRIPIQELLAAFESIGKGNLETRLLSHPEEPELKQIFRGLNNMTEQIKNFVNELSMQTEELNRIVSTIQTGIVLLDKKGKIILSNRYFREIFSLSKAKEKYFWEVVRDERLNEQISQLIEKRKNFSIEIQLFHNDYLCSGIYIDKKDKAIIIFDDIDRSKKLAQVKRDLISNLSHELRTPLTSIKGYIETLEENRETSELEKEKYFAIIKRNTQRLINMVDDLLQLSELEDKVSKLEIEMCNLKEMLNSLYKIFLPGLKEKNLALRLDIAEDIPEIEADSYKIEQMFVNLIDNAVKYTEKGTIDVVLQLLDSQRVKIEIVDTGIGIEKKNLDRIFERFYVVNKARSRKQGGTGLGLSIVKHIVKLHHGTIEVKSQIGIGTSVTVNLPVHQSEK